MDVWYILCIAVCIPFASGTYISNDNETTYAVQYEECICGEKAKCSFDEQGQKTCECEEGYRMNKEGICQECNCGEKGECSFDEKGQKTCACEEGYSIDKENTCKECNCGKQGRCNFDEEGQKTCACMEGYAINKEGTCQACECGIKSTGCTFENDRKICMCIANHTQMRGICIDPCAFDLCKNGGVCVINGTDFMCECKSRYFGKLCQFHPCHSNPCLNDGACIAVENDYGCVCREPFNGKHCEIDPCSSYPCMNEGVCNVVGIDFNCTCKAPYSGRQCQFDPCSPNPCKNNGICHADYDKYNCYCKMPFWGLTCENIGKVDNATTTEPNTTRIWETTTEPDRTRMWDTSPETNTTRIWATTTEPDRTRMWDTSLELNTTRIWETTTEPTKIRPTTPEFPSTLDECYCGINSLNCYLYQGKKLCKCKENYAQKNGTCTETCKSHSDCLNGGMCKVQGLRRFCKCPDVYLGDRCQIDVCRHMRYTCTASGAMCKRQGETGVCQCPDGKALSRSSGRCEDICDYDKCVHGYCKIIAGVYKCVCNDGFTGRHCDKSITQVTDAVSLKVIILILSIGIVIFAAAAIIAIVWVKRLNEKLQKN